MSKQKRCSRGLAPHTLCDDPRFRLAAETTVRQTNAGDPNLQLQFDTTVRYNLRLRTQDLDQNFSGNAAGLGDVTAFQSDPSHWRRQLDRGKPLFTSIARTRTSTRSS